MTERQALRRQLAHLLDRRWMALLAGNRALKLDLDVQILEVQKAMRDLGAPPVSAEPLPGWFGDVGHLLHFLRTVGADRDDEGMFVLSGAPPAVGLGGRDVVVPAETVYFVGGSPRGLAAGLGGTSYGMRITVI